VVADVPMTDVGNLTTPNERRDVVLRRRERRRQHRRVRIEVVGVAALHDHGIHHNVRTGDGHIDLGPLAGVRCAGIGLNRA
jgi:hypothetical protein